MKYKLFGIDLDGTLLSKNKRISNKNLQALSRYINDGGIPVIITGRSFVSSREYVRKIEQYTQSKMPFLVGFNGAYIQNTKTKQITKQVIDKEIVRDLWNLVIKKRCGIWVYIDDKKYEKLVYANKKWLAVFAKSSREIELRKSKQAISSSAYKVNIMSLSTSKIKTIREYLTSKYGNELEVSYTHPLLLEVTKKGVNKGYAILKMANQLNIKRENIVCVGDSGNDIPMAKVSGKSFGLKSRNKQLMKNVDVYLKNKTNAIAKIIDNYLIDNGIELIVSDLDGTLLDNYTKLVHTDTAHVLKKAMHEKGCKFAIATGRGLDDCLLVFKSLHLKPQNNLYVIGTNGSFVFDCTTWTYLYKKFMLPDVAKQLRQCFIDIYKSKHNGPMGAQIYIEPDLSIKKPHTIYLINKKVVLDALSANTPHFMINNWAKKNSIEVDDVFNFQKIFKVVFYCNDNDDRARLLGLILSKKLPLTISSSGLKNLEIMPEGCTKGAGVEHLATRLNIDKNNVMVVGDEQNDISMLKKFKNSITLASSKPDVREAATYVIDAKPSTVVKKAIQKIVFNDE